MVITFPHRGQTLHADLSRPLDISLPLTPGPEQVNAFYIPSMVIEPVRIGDFVGDVLQGASCNVNDVRFNPHGNGTHTETVGHISKEKESIHDCLKRYWFLADLVSVQPAKVFDDWVIMPEQLEHALSDPKEALIIRTRPNDEAKRSRKYSGTNPVFLHHEAAAAIADAGVRHLLIDLPSVDKEEDGGRLMAHKAFWMYPAATRTDATITELIYVPDEIPDGLYLLNLQTINIMNDASPSRPVLYHLFHDPGRL
jgi:arylformamidase